MKIVGITNDVTDCDCCGRTNLKRTVELMNEFGFVRHFGTGCAATHLSLSKTQVKNKAINEQDKKEISENRKARFQRALNEWEAADGKMSGCPKGGTLWEIWTFSLRSLNGRRFNHPTDLVAWLRSEVSN